MRAATPPRDNPGHRMSSILALSYLATYIQVNFVKKQKRGGCSITQKFCLFSALLAAASVRASFVVRMDKHTDGCRLHPQDLHAKHVAACTHQTCMQTMLQAAMHKPQNKYS